jgi:CubicO group peptidase (beta-lactamase class C family)
VIHVADQCDVAGIDGTHDPAFQVVHDAFAANFDQGELGASCAVTVHGDLKVDLWGGHRDLARQRPWERDTIVNVWSSTKTAAALCVLMLHDRGTLSLDEPMATYWPEFAANDKESVLIRHVLGHTAGLPVFDDVPDDLTVFDWDECCHRLAAQSPRWSPGDGSGYHAETQGWLLGELIRRVDGRTLGAFFREEVAEPLGVDLHIGLHDDHFHRVADMTPFAADLNEPDDTELRERAQASSRRSAALVNTSAWRRAEFPASNGHGNARSLALALAPLANGGALNGVRLLSSATIERIFEVQADGVDRVLGREVRLGIGYGLVCDATPLGVNDRTCWWAGWGGSMCVVDVENRMTVSYTMNRMLGEGDLRAIRVVFAAHEAMG